MSVTLVIDAPPASVAAIAHAIVQRLCDAHWLGSSRRARLRALLDPTLRGESRIDAGRIDQATVERARALLHDRVDAVASVIADAVRDDAPTGVRVERFGSAIRITIAEPRRARSVTELADWGTGELLAAAWVVEDLHLSDPGAATGSW